MKLEFLLERKYNSYGYRWWKTNVIEIEGESSQLTCQVNIHNGTPSLINAFFIKTKTNARSRGWRGGQELWSFENICREKTLICFNKVLSIIGANKKRLANLHINILNEFFWVPVMSDISSENICEANSRKLKKQLNIG